MNNYNVAKILGDYGLNFPKATIYNNVEIRPASADFVDERKYLEESLESNNLKISVDINCRISCIVQANSESDAVQFADKEFEEILDLKSKEIVFGRLLLSTCGFVKNLADGKITPLKDSNLGPRNTFIRQFATFQNMDKTHVFFQWNNELSTRYRKSLHWSRNEKNESNRQFKILFMWFSVEALIKENTNDQVAPVIMWFLGFPNGTCAQYINSEINSLLRSHEHYRKWKRKLGESLERIRNFRNDSVHSGFRSFDFSHSELKLYENIMVFGSSRCQEAVMEGLRNGLETVSEFKDYIGVIFENYSNIEHDIHNTVLCALENT